MLSSQDEQSLFRTAARGFCCLPLAHPERPVVAGTGYRRTDSAAIFADELGVFWEPTSVVVEYHAARTRIGTWFAADVSEQGRDAVRRQAAESAMTSCLGATRIGSPTPAADDVELELDGPTVTGSRFDAAAAVVAVIDHPAGGVVSVRWPADRPAPAIVSSGDALGLF